MDLTKQKSEEQALVINMIATPVMLLDVDYCKALASQMLAQASKQEAMSILSVQYSQIKTDILRKQGEALRSLCEYVSALKQVGELTQSLDAENKQRAEINGLFL